jgi:AcrR family transcriptional regulator
MTFAEFQKQIETSQQDFYRETLANHRDVIRVKKEGKALVNLEKIFSATLKLSNQKGFAAMSMRDLSKETGLSMGALYAYFSSKDEILSMLQEQQRAFTKQFLMKAIEGEQEPRKKLRAAVRAHLFLSEAMQAWFYFSYMEAKNLPAAEKARAVKSERFTETLFADIFASGQVSGVFNDADCRLTASCLKAMLQDWYLKRGKYASRGVTVERYAQFLLEMIESFVSHPDCENQPIKGPAPGNRDCQGER